MRDFRRNDNSVHSKLNTMKIFPIIFILIILQSCQIQIIGITNDYDKLNENQKNLIKPLENFQNLNIREVYTINAMQLKDELKKHERSLVYIFTNGCSAEACKPIYVYEDYAKKNGYSLFLVMNGFGDIDKTLVQDISSPLFAMDANYYETPYTRKYSRYFENELMGLNQEEKQKEFLGSLYFFEDGKFLKIAKNLPD